MKRLFALGLCACSVPLASGIPPGVHPTGVAGQTSAGISVGGLVAMDEAGEGQEDNTQLVLPWGEGWVRWGRGNGQLELHVLPGLGSVGYRFDLAPMGPGVGFALVPSVHAALTYAWEEDPDGDETDAGILMIGAGLTGLVLIPSGSGYIYIAPRLGLTNARAIGDVPENAESINLLTVGAAFGIDFGGQGGFGTTFEVAIQRANDLESDIDTEAIWLIVPTFGLRL